MKFLNLPNISITGSPCSKTKRQHLGNLSPLTAFGNDLVFTSMYFWCGKQVSARYFPCVNHYGKFTNSFGNLAMFSSQTYLFPVTPGSLT